MRFFKRSANVDEEIRTHLEMAARDRTDRGESADDARSGARREFGNVLAVQETTRDAGGWPAIARLAQDVRHALRRLRLSPITGAAAIVMLGLAVGITTAMFTVADALLVRPVPFPNADRIMPIVMFASSPSKPSSGTGRSDVSPAVLRAWRDSGVFEAVEAATHVKALLETAEGPAVRDGALVSPGLFAMLGAPPIRGRLFGADDGRGEVGRRVVIAEDLWRGPLQADPNVIGRTLTLNNESVEVIGVMPSEFRFPRWTTSFWRPVDFETLPPGAKERPSPFVRIAAHVPAADAFKVATDRAHEVDPTTAKWRVTTFGMVNRDGAYFERAIQLLSVGVFLVFLVLAANVAGLLLGRLDARRRELSLCAALGASRARLIRQALVEHAVTAVLGSGVGVALAWTLVSVARAGLPDSVLAQTLNPLNLDLRALAAAVGAATLAMLTAGVLPAILATDASPSRGGSLGDRSRTESRRARFFTRTLLVTEVALACTLLIGGTLLVRSFVNLTNANRGFDPRGLVEFALDVDRKTFPRPADRAAIAESVRASLATLPGIANAVLWGGCGLHFGEWHSDLTGVPAFTAMVDERCVGQDFFKMYGVRLLRGRHFEPGDPEGTAIVGERLAGALWPNQDPVGHSMTIDKQRFTVVGVASEMNRPTLDKHYDYADLYSILAGGQTISLRCSAGCPSEGAIRQRVRSITASAQPFSFQFLEQVYAEDLAQPRATAAVGVAFSAVALMAVAGGLFGVLTSAVNRRRREFGVRAALGASPARLRWEVLGDGLFVAMLGIGIGAVSGWLLMRLLTSLQYGVSATDPMSWTIVVATLVLTTVVAAWRPARQAMRSDPATLLRQD